MPYYIQNRGMTQSAFYDRAVFGCIPVNKWQSFPFLFPIVISVFSLNEASLNTRDREAMDVFVSTDVPTKAGRNPRHSHALRERGVHDCIGKIKRAANPSGRKIDILS